MTDTTTKTIFDGRAMDEADRPIGGDNYLTVIDRGSTRSCLPIVDITFEGEMMSMSDHELPDTIRIIGNWEMKEFAAQMVKFFEENGLMP
jgi:hypothetical protein